MFGQDYALLWILSDISSCIYLFCCRAMSNC